MTRVSLKIFFKFLFPLSADLLINDAELSPPSDTNQLKKNDLSDQKILENTKNVDTLNERSAIHNCIINGDIETAIRLIGEIAPNLLNSNQKLQFKLLRQQLVELIRNKSGFFKLIFGGILGGIGTWGNFLGLFFGKVLEGICGVKGRNGSRKWVELKKLPFILANES